MGIRFLTSAPSKTECEIIRALTNEVKGSESGYFEVFKPYIKPLNDPTFEDRIRWVSKVIQETDQKKVIPAGEGYDSHEVFLTKEIGVDLSNKNWISSNSERKSLGKCFPRKARPKISDLGLNALALKESARIGPTETWPNIWQFSEVIRSSDEQYAIIFASSHCGGFCAWWGFYLFENNGQTWDVIGYHTEAIS